MPAVPNNLPATSLSDDDIDDERIQIQFRLGSALVAKIDRVAKFEKWTRNDWLVDACVRKLKGEGEPGVFIASELTNSRIPVLFRVGSKIRQAIDEDYKAKGITSRTMWVVEAILASLAQYEFEPSNSDESSE